jgi:iron complex outermembrane receptor protein
VDVQVLRKAVRGLGNPIDRSVDPEAGRCGNSETTWSASASVVRRITGESNVFLSVSRSERAPGVEELLSNVDPDTCIEPADPEQLVVHAPTARFEIGNTALNTETSRNVELAFRKHAGDVRAEINLFHNRVDDYIYLADTGEFEETIVSRYLQDQVTFSGVETELTVPVPLGANYHMDLLLFGDAVRAEFDRGGNVPRIPPRRLGVELGFPMDAWVFKLRATSVDDQSDVAANETPTDGYTRLDLYADYHLDTPGGEWLFFLKGSNLTDEVIRNHVSFLKHYAPEPGRGVEAGLRYRF